MEDQIFWSVHVLLSTVCCFNLIPLFPAHSLWVFFPFYSLPSFCFFRFAWHFSGELRPFWPTLHLWWFWFYLSFLFCVADCCAERLSGVFLVLFEVAATLFINHRSVTQENYLTVYFCHWYLFIGHLSDCFFFCKSVAFLWRVFKVIQRGVTCHYRVI